MASKLQHTVSYPFSTARLWAIYTTEKYWHDLVERMNSGHGHVEKVTITGDTVTLMATDRYRLALREISWRPAAGEIPTRPGVYRFRTNLAMAGGWALTLTAKVQGEEGTVENRLVFRATP